MFTLKRLFCCALCSVPLLLACGGSNDQAADSVASAGSDSALMAPAAPLSAANLAGTWDVIATPVRPVPAPANFDTTSTKYVLTAKSDNNGWTVTYPNRPPVPARVSFDADSVTIDVGPYESVRRRGVQVRTKGVFTYDGEAIMSGQAMAHYTTSGADSVLLLMVMGRRRQ